VHSCSPRLLRVPEDEEREEHAATVLALEVEHAAALEDVRAPHTARIRATKPVSRYGPLTGPAYGLAGPAYGLVQGLSHHRSGPITTV